MNADLLKSYIKYSYKSIILWLVIILLLNWFDHSNSLSFNLFFLIVGIIQGYYHYCNKLETIKKLKAKGLTEQDLLNIEFVKKWETTRQEGPWKYCIRDGGIIVGAGLSVVVSLIYFIIFPTALKTIEASPGNMISFIGYAYISGAIIGVILYRILWWYNEKRFTRLTDPFNILFASKTASFNDNT